jgi:hypothetical protein
MTQEQLKKVLAMLESRAFEQWYTLEFRDYIEGVDDAPSKEQILKWLAEKLGDK